jgi:DNA polymerase I
LTRSIVSSKNLTSRLEGWILDLYPKDGCIVIWLKTKDNIAIRLVDTWQQCFYVAGDFRDIVSLAHKLRIEGMSFEERLVKPEDEVLSTVLKIPVKNVSEAERLAERILVFGRHKRYELYNVNVKPSQLYMYEKGIFPFAYVKATTSRENIGWELLDDLESTDYDAPPLREITLSINIQKKGRLPGKADAIEAITLTSRNQVHRSEGFDERQKLLWLVETLRVLDPDVIYTTSGDSFLFPYLIHRASVNGIANQFVLSREPSSLRVSTESGQSYTSYGRVHYRATPTRLLGRIHIDCEDSMLYRDCKLPGSIEVARLCRMSIQRVINTTIGTSMTSVQLYEATRIGVLIPWRKTNAEELKTASELLISDRGGFYYEPTIGLYESVGELDFTSLYPMIMLTKNLSGETVRCKCCPDSKNRVPELDYNICEKRLGIVPRSLQHLLQKRLLYKRLKQTTTDPALRGIYEMRQAALKWILVCAFGYLGFKNARFGRIDAHIATCAFARRILKDVVHLAEAKGFRLIHGIVDSLWLKKEDATEEDYRGLQAEIEEMSHLPISFEGIYRWIVFPPSKIHRNIPVLNRYYGVFRDGKIKDRGIATRRQDTPPIIDRCIQEIMNILSDAEDTRDFYKKLPSAHEIVNRFVSALRSGNVSLEELAIRKRFSQGLDEYKHDVLQAVAAKHLVQEGAALSAGESVNYIITNNRSKVSSRRALPLELCMGCQTYDSEAYVDLLLSAVETMLPPFGFSKPNISFHLTRSSRPSQSPRIRD